MSTKGSVLNDFEMHVCVIQKREGLLSFPKGAVACPGVNMLAGALKGWFEGPQCE